MESNDEIPLVCSFVYMFYICCLIVSSPYLFVFDDDRVCGTQEQMMLQVDLERPKARAGLDGEKRFIRVFMFYGFGIIL